MTRFQRLAIVWILAFTGCTSTVTPSATPIAQPSVPLPASRIPTALPSQSTLSPTHLPPLTPKGPPPTSTPTATPTTSPTASILEGRSPFRQVDDFLGPHDQIEGIGVGGPGYVAVGLSLVDNGCSSEGRVWTSPSGREWTLQQTEMPNQYLELVIDFEGELIAFGHEINNCSDVGPGTIWRSSDGGATWKHAVTLSAAGPGHWMDTTTTVGRVLATTAGTSGVRVWLSDDGLEWRGPSGNGPARRYLGGLNGLVVSSNATYEEEVTVMTSSDRGESWEEVALELRGEFRPSFAANNGLLVGVFSEFERAWPMTTQDGLTWTAAEEPLQTDVDKVVAVPGGFLSLSNRGSTYLSADGLDWFAGPPQRMLTDDRGIREAVADEVGVLLFTMDFRNARQYDEHLWFAPIGAFDPFWSTD